MLICLQIRDFAIIDQLELELGRGLNVLTGETGAGKSIMMSALELVLGGKGKLEHVRAGAERAEVEALFDIGGDASIRPELDAFVGDQGGHNELVVRCVVMQNGRTRHYVNGRLTTRAQLSRLTRGLTHISSQHQHYTLLDPATHLDYLDAFGRLAADRRQVRDRYRSLEKAEALLADFEARLRERSVREALAREAVQEIEAIAPQLGEEAQLEQDSTCLRNAEALLKLAGEAADLLYERDESSADTLARAEQLITQAGRLDPDFGNLLERLELARSLIEDTARELSSKCQSIRSDPLALERIEERLFALAKLKRRYGGTLEAVLAHLDRCRIELDELEGHVDVGRRLQASHSEALREAVVAGRALSMKRRGVAKRLAAAITRELAALGMSDAKFQVAVAPLSGRGISADGVRLGPDGMDAVEFLMSTNHGEPARSLHKVASGGELSRTMLAIKCVLGGVGPSGLYAFDEVDSGVSGAIAEVIGRKIHAVASHRQVLCVTHLPQIAVFADHHFKVEKVLKGERTLSTIRKLNASERREEIARMLGGMKITHRTRAAARELLLQARRKAA